MNDDQRDEICESHQPPFSELMLRWLDEGDVLQSAAIGDGEGDPDAKQNSPGPRLTRFLGSSPDSRRSRVLLGGAALIALGFILVTRRYTAHTDASSEVALVTPHESPVGADEQASFRAAGSSPDSYAAAVAALEPVVPAELTPPPTLVSLTPVTWQTEPESPPVLQNPPSAPVGATVAVTPAEPESLPSVAKPEPRSHLRDCRTAVARENAREGLRQCTAALAESPNSATALVLLARANLLGGREGESLRLAQNALALDSRLPDAYLLVGSVQQSVGHTEYARSAYEAYLRLSPMGRHASEVRAVLRTL